MRGGFQLLVHGGCRVSEVDVDASRVERERLHEQVRLRNHLLGLLVEAPVDEELVRVTPYRLLDGVPAEPDWEVG